MFYRKNIAQGRFIPRHPEKYSGDSTKIFFRSGLELKLMNFFDLHESVIHWSSEEVIVPYHDPSQLNRPRRYFPDFVIEKRAKDGTINKIMVEVKPYSQTKPPRIKKQTKYAIKEASEYVRNQAKWDAAKKYCADRGWKFSVLTEREIN